MIIEVLSNLDLITKYVYIFAGAAVLIMLVIKFVHVLKPSNAKALKLKAKKKAAGVVFGKKGFKLAVSPEHEEGHIVVFGGTGLGKTTGLLIPTLNHWRAGTAFVIDIAGDIAKNADIPNKLIYDPENSDSIPYNIFYEIDMAENVEDKNELLAKLAYLLMPDTPKSSDAGEYYNDEGRNILTAALIYYYHAGMDFVEICETINKYSWHELLNDIDDPDNPAAFKYVSGFMDINEKTAASCKQETNKAIDLFVTKKPRKTIRRPVNGEKCFSPDQLEKNSVFVVVPARKLDIYGPLLRIVTAQSLDYFYSRPPGSKNTILFCLDEFAAFGKMDISNALKQLRKQHIRIMVLTQSLADIDTIYGKSERAAMLNNFSYKVVLGCEDAETQEYFSKTIGDNITTKRTVSEGENGKTYTTSEHWERVYKPHELGFLDNNLIVVTRGGHMKLKKNFAHK